MRATDSYAREGTSALRAHVEPPTAGDAPELPRYASIRRAPDGDGFVDRYGRDSAACRANAERAQAIGTEVARLWNLVNADHVLLGREVARKSTQQNRLELLWRTFVTISERDLEWADALELLAAWDESQRTNARVEGGAS